jgi:hypothetical protein
MAGEHVFEKVRRKTRVVIHVAMPGGNNSVGVPWADVLEHTGYSKKTQLAESTKTMVDSGEVDEEENPIMVEEETVGVGQISDAERADIMAGNVLEFQAMVKLPDNATIATMNKLAARAWDDWSDEMIKMYSNYGHTQA